MIGFVLYLTISFLSVIGFGLLALAFAFIVSQVGTMILQVINMGRSHYDNGTFLFDLILYVPSTIFQLNRDRSSWVEPVLS